MRSLRIEKKANKSPANRKQGKRPGAEPLGSDFGKNIAHLRRLRPAPVAKAIADDLVREQEGLRVQLATETANVIRVGEECLIRRRMLDVLSHALERANEVIKWLPDFRQLEGWEIVAVQHSFEAERLLKGTAKLQADLAAANSRIAELTAELDAERTAHDDIGTFCFDLGASSGDGSSIEAVRGLAEMFEARIARLTADLEFERGVNKITTGTLCLSAQNEVGLATQIRSQQKELESLRQTPATTSGNQWLQAGFAVLTTQAEPERPKRKPWYRRSFTELLTGRGGAEKI